MSVNKDDKKIEIIKQYIEAHPDFPKKGILFRDIFSVLLHPEVFALVREILNDYSKSIQPSVECVAAIEARGFLLGPILALDLQVPFVPIRKKGKLPGKVVSYEYSLEYGTDTLEIQEKSIMRGMNVLLIDDLLATGGTMNAACELLKQCDAKVIACCVIMELTALGGVKKIPVPVHSLIKY